MKPANQAGSTWLNVLAAVAILGLLAALGLGLMDLTRKRAVRNRAESEIAQIAAFVADYQVQYGNVPQTREELAEALRDSEHPRAGLLDPWGNPVEYQTSSLATYFLWSTGGGVDPALIIGRAP